MAADVSSASMCFSVNFVGPRSCVPQTNWIRNSWDRSEARRVGPAAEPNSRNLRVATSRAAGLGLRRAMTAATRLQSRAVPALLASRSRRRASPPASAPNSHMSTPAAACIRSTLSNCQSNQASMSAFLVPTPERPLAPALELQTRLWSDRPPRPSGRRGRRRIHYPTERSILSQARCQKINAGQSQERRRGSFAKARGRILQAWRKLFPSKRKGNPSLFLPSSTSFQGVT